MSTLVPLVRRGADDFERELLEAGTRESPRCDAEQRALLAVSAAMTAEMLAGSASATAFELGLGGAGGRAAAPNLTGAAIQATSSLTLLTVQWVGIGVTLGLLAGGVGGVLIHHRAELSAANGTMSARAPDAPLPHGPASRFEGASVTAVNPEVYPEAKQAIAPLAGSVRASTTAARIAAETALLDRARSALMADDPGRAAEALREHARLPSPALGPEAELLGIELAIAHGDHEQARARALVFLRTHAGSPHARRVRSLLVRAAAESVIDSPPPGHRRTEVE